MSNNKKRNGSWRDPVVKTKQSYYLPQWMLDEIRAEATRMDRSISWILREAWKISRAQLLAVPGVNDPPVKKATDPNRVPN